MKIKEDGIGFAIQENGVAIREFAEHLSDFSTLFQYARMYFEKIEYRFDRDLDSLLNYMYNFKDEEIVTVYLYKEDEIQQEYIMFDFCEPAIELYNFSMDQVETFWASPEGLGIRKYVYKEEL